MELKVGELAARTGVSVRTLHWYEEVGLLEPARRSAAGHRLYGLDEVVRLQQIRSLVQLGFSLDEVGDCLGRPEYSIERVVQMHLARLDESISRQRRLHRRLAAIASRLSAAEEVSVDDFLRTIEEITMLETYYTPDQLAELERRKGQLGPDGMEKAQQDWADLIADVRVEMEKGSDPESEPVQALARRWQGLIDAFTGGDPGIERSLGGMWDQEMPRLQEQYRDSVPPPEMFEYMGRALAVLRR